MEKSKTLILDKLQLEQKLNRMAHEIYENHCDDKELVIIGIADRGYTVAKSLHKVLAKISDLSLKLVELHINKKNPNNIVTDLEEYKLSGKVVLLVDDVLNTGKTLIYGVKQILDQDIKILKTAVLVNRRHRNYPVRADYVGLTLSTTLKEHISVELDVKKKEGVFLN
jgi:pyrimidine operon attenuation protein/uracil phosphoribosyltransferase